MKRGHTHFLIGLLITLLLQGRLLLLLFRPQFLLVTLLSLHFDWLPFWFLLHHLLFHLDTLLLLFYHTNILILLFLQFIFSFNLKLLCLSFFYRLRSRVNYFNRFNHHVLCIKLILLLLIFLDRRFIYFNEMSDGLDKLLLLTHLNIDV